MIRAVVFDVGDVLVRWDVHQAFLPDLGDRDAVDAFMQRTDFRARNQRADAGESWAELTAEIDDSADRLVFARYLARFALTVQRRIPESWALIDALRGRGLAVHAITNWSAETWPRALALHPRLGSAFQVAVVSGYEGLTKPDPRIFDLLCARAGVPADQCLFIDDIAQNVAGARAAGMHAEQFTTPQALTATLIARGLL